MFKRFCVFSVVVLSALLSSSLVEARYSQSASTYNETYVNGYTRSDGTQVQGHYRSAPNHNSYDNWSTIGNVNPHTEERGTHRPYPTRY